METSSSSSNSPLSQPSPPPSATISTLRSFLFSPSSSSAPTPSAAGGSTTRQLPGSWADTLTLSNYYRTSTPTSVVPGKGKGSKRAPLAGLFAAPPPAEAKGEGEQEGDWEEVVAQTKGLSLSERQEEKEMEWSRAREKDRLLAEIAEKVLWQGGTDPFDPPGPLLVLAPCHIPDPSPTLDHPSLLTKLRERLETFTLGGPYSLVLLTNPTPHPPSTALLVSNYLALDRMSRKNVRKVWVVGAGWWVRVIITIFSTTLLSGKTAKRRKLVQCTCLSDLAKEMGSEGFTRIEFPPEVYAANAVLESSITLPPSPNPPPKLFGETLEVLMGSEAEFGLPKVVKDCLSVLDSNLDAVGIFRRSPSSSVVTHLVSTYSRGHPVTLSSYPDAAYLSASLLKQFLRELPTSLFPPSLFPSFRACPLPNQSPTASISYITTTLLPLFNPPSLLLLQSLIELLNKISAESERGLMDSTNLVICLGPAVIGGLEEVGGDGWEMCKLPWSVGGGAGGTVKPAGGGGGNTVAGVLWVMIESYDEIFTKDYLDSQNPIIRPPLFSSTSSSSTSIPSYSPSQITPITEEDPFESNGVRRPLSSSLPVAIPLSSPPKSLPASPILSTSHSSTTTSSSTSKKGSAGSGASGKGTGTMGFRTLKARNSLRGELTVGEGIRGVFSVGELGDGRKGEESI